MGNPPLTIIGLSGKAGSGKDYLGRTYLRPLGFECASLADHFKLTVIGRGLASYDDVYRTKPDAVRALLQQEGTERGRDVYGEQVWVETLLARLRREAEVNGRTKWYIPDVRFVSEVQGLQTAGGHVIRVLAPDRHAAAPLTDAQRLHRSEVDLDPYDPVQDPATGRWEGFERLLCDACVDNRVHRAGEVAQQMAQILRVWDVIPPQTEVTTTPEGTVTYVEHAPLEDCVTCL